MMEWELTLQQVLDELEFQIINQPGQFYILDPPGNRSLLTLSGAALRKRYF